MKGYWTKTHSFTDGASKISDISYFSVSQDDLSEQEVPHTIFTAIAKKQWYQLSHVNWNSVGIAFLTVPTELALAISENGEIWAYTDGAERPEALNHTTRMLRNISVIEGEAYACGMDRQVFRRQDKGTWQELHAVAPKMGETLGFEAIDGFNRKDIYAVGWEGEIWRFDGARWKNCSSPVNVILTGICCASDGSVYACGQEGVVLRGSKDTWEVILNENVEQDMWDVVEFNNKIYFASKTNVYELIDNDLKIVALQSDSINSAGRFTARDGVLWSIGEKDVFCFDGSDWLRID